MAVMEDLLRRLHHHHHQLIPTPRAFFSLRTQKPLSHFHFHCPTFSICRCNHHHVLLLSPTLHILRARQSDSNAESFDFDGEDDTADQWFELLDDYIDSIWIFKVFRSFGWMLPAIVLSMLLTTGPKAFLLALAVPIGQSTFAFAIQRYLNRGKIKTKRKSRTKARRGRMRWRTYSSRNVKFKVEEERVRQEVRKKEKGFPSWGSDKDVWVSSNGSSASSYGGWDELELDEVVEESAALGSTRKRKASQNSPAGKGEIGKGGRRRRSVPLLLRLIISMFPFLSSLTEILV